MGQSGIVQRITAVIDRLRALRTLLDPCMSLLLLHACFSQRAVKSIAVRLLKPLCMTVTRQEWASVLLTVTKWRWSSLASAFTTSTAQSMSVSGLGCQQP